MESSEAVGAQSRSRSWWTWPEGRILVGSSVAERTGRGGGRARLQVAAVAGVVLAERAVPGRGSDQARAGGAAWDLEAVMEA